MVSCVFQAGVGCGRHMHLGREAERVVVQRHLHLGRHLHLCREAGRVVVASGICIPVGMHDGRRCERHRHLGRQGHRQCLELFQASSVAWCWTSRRGAAWCCGWATGYLVRNGDNLLLLYDLKGHYYEQGRPSSGRPPARVCGGIGMVLSSGWPQHSSRSLPG